MRWSQLHVPTLRDDPADADAPSHRLLLRAGHIRPLPGGHYALLPLAVRVRAKVIGIVRAELAGIGGQEFVLPAHAEEREIFGALAAELDSYRRLPQRWFHFRSTVRDEPRPKSGLLRARESTVQESYSFDLDPAGLDRSFSLYQGAYERIFARLGLPAIAVETSGGVASIAFMVLSQAGGDLVVRCPSCDYAADSSKASSALPAAADPPGVLERFDTPGARTIEDLAVRYDAPADRQIKTLVYVLDGALTLVLLRGDHQLSERKLAGVTGARSLRPAQPEEIRDALGALPGSLGAVGVRELPIIADEALRGRRAMFTGANIDDVHLRGVDVDRDIAVGVWADLREVAAGEPCPRCGSPLEPHRAIEVGRIATLGAGAVDATVLNASGGRVPLLVGSYSLGVERAMAAIVECRHDDRGIIWPLSVAPYQVAVVAAQAGDAEVSKAAEDLYDKLRTADVEVVLDDRDERAGVKFRDAELTGIPYRITVGRRGLAENSVEITTRETGETIKIPLVDAVPDILDRLS